MLPRATLALLLLVGSCPVMAQEEMHILGLSTLGVGDSGTEPGAAAPRSAPARDVETVDRWIQDRLDSLLGTPDSSGQPLLEGGFEVKAAVNVEGVLFLAGVKGRIGLSRDGSRYVVVLSQEGDWGVGVGLPGVASAEVGNLARRVITLEADAAKPGELTSLIWALAFGGSTKAQKLWSLAQSIPPEPYEKLANHATRLVQASTGFAAEALELERSLIRDVAAWQADRVDDVVGSVGCSLGFLGGLIGGGRAGAAAGCRSGETIARRFSPSWLTRQGARLVDRGLAIPQEGLARIRRHAPVVALLARAFRDCASPRELITRTVYDFGVRGSVSARIPPIGEVYGGAEIALGSESRPRTQQTGVVAKLQVGAGASGVMPAGQGGAELSGFQSIKVFAGADGRTLDRLEIVLGGSLDRNLRPFGLMLPPSALANASRSEKMLVTLSFDGLGDRLARARVNFRDFCLDLTGKVRRALRERTMEPLLKVLEPFGDPMIEWSRISGTTARGGATIGGLVTLQGDLSHYRVLGGTQVNFPDIVMDPTP